MRNDELPWDELLHGRLSPVHHDERTLYAAIPRDFLAVRYHSLVVGAVPAELRVTAWTPDGVNMALEHRDRPLGRAALPGRQRHGRPERHDSYARGLARGPHDRRGVTSRRARRATAKASAAPDRERTVPLVERTAPLIGIAAGTPS